MYKWKPWSAYPSDPGLVILLRMARLLTVIFLIVSLLGQGALAGDVSWTLETPDDVSHAMMHLENEGHHHHDDGSYKADDSAESSLHVMSDHGGCCVLMSDGLWLSPVYVTDNLPVFSVSLHQSPSLDGPLRPPRLIS